MLTLLPSKRRARQFSPLNAYQSHQKYFLRDLDRVCYKVVHSEPDYQTLCKKKRIHVSQISYAAVTMPPGQSYRKWSEHVNINRYYYRAFSKISLKLCHAKRQN